MTLWLASMHVRWLPQPRLLLARYLYRFNRSFWSAAESGRCGGTPLGGGSRT
jgi:hypothetical protein